MIVGCIAPNYNFFSHNHTYVEKMAIFFKGNCDPIGDTPIFHVTMCFFSRKGIASRVPPQPQLIDVSPPHRPHTQPFLTAKLGSLKEPESMFLKKKLVPFHFWKKIASHQASIFFSHLPRKTRGNSLKMANSSLEG